MDPTVPAPLLVLGRRYVLERRVGAGASGRVYRSYDRLLATTVAVKLVTGGDADELRRHRSEVATVSRLSHPGLVPLLDVGIEPAADGGPGTPYYGMEYVDGPSLARRLEGPALSAAALHRTAVALAATLAHVHANGVVHRDLKPSNILIGPDGGPRLTDFGVAWSADGSAGLTATGSVVGTPRYMAPEQVRGEPVTPACDVYALALVLLECVTGRPEYPGPAIESAVSRLFRPPQVPDRLAEPLRGLLRAMTAADPADRPTAAEVHRVLSEPATARLPVADLLPFRFEQLAVLPPGARRHRGLVVAAAAAGLLAAGSLAMAATGHGAAPPAAAAAEVPLGTPSVSAPGPAPTPEVDGTLVDGTAAPLPAATGGTASGVDQGDRPGGASSTGPVRRVTVRADQAGSGRSGSDRQDRERHGKDRRKGHGKGKGGGPGSSDD